MATTTAGRNPRGARAAIFAAMCVGLSAAGHVWMSGDVIPLWAVAFAFAVAHRVRLRARPPAARLPLARDAHAPRRARPAPTCSRRRRARPHRRPGAAHLRLRAASCPHRRGPAACQFRDGPRRRRDDRWRTAWPDCCAWWLRCGDAAVFRLLRVPAALVAPVLLLLQLARAPVVPDFRAPCRRLRRRLLGPPDPAALHGRRPTRPAVPPRPHHLTHPLALTLIP